MKSTLILFSLFVFFAGFTRISRSFYSKTGVINDSVVVKNVGGWKSIIEYRNGEINGRSIRLYPNGDTLDITFYKAGKRHGQHTAFFEGNRVALISFYDEDYTTGEWLRWDSMGQLTVKQHFAGRYLFDDPRWSGEELFYSGGELAYIQIWTNGRRSDVIVKNNEGYERLMKNDIPLGKKLSMELCQSCHIPGQNLFAPSLKNVAGRYSDNWLVNFTRNADSLVEVGDGPARKVYERYNSAKHPDFTYLTAGDVKAIIEYIGKL